MVLRWVMVAMGAFVAALLFLAATSDSARTTHVQVVERWLAALAGGEADRGWHLLDASATDHFRNDPDEYIAAAEATEWDGFRWRIDGTTEYDGGFVTVQVLIESGFSAVPEFLVGRLVVPHCLGTNAVGFSVWVDVPLFGEPSLGPGAMTGTAERGSCGSSGTAPQPQFLPADPATTEHEFELWNWTEIPIFIVADDGRRVDLAPCSKRGVDDLADQLEIRAVGGYIATIGGMRTGFGDEWTIFVVVGSEEVYVNAGPPAEPMPPCQGRPDVQAGF